MKKDIDDIKLIESYTKHQSIRKVGEEFGISHETARYKLKKLSVLNKPIVYSWDDNYFSKDTPDSFYWAGFIAADGCVKLKDKKYKQLSIGLSQKDHVHLEKFKQAINFTGCVHKISSNGIDKSEVKISSEKIFNDLAKFNVVPRKTLTYSFPEWIMHHNLVNHFMRGYFDGDGSFYKSVNRKTGRTVEQLYFSLRGTREFLNSYNKILERKCNFKKHKSPRFNSGIYTLEFGGNIKVHKITDFLYKESHKSIRLDRKYKIATEDSNNIA